MEVSVNISTLLCFRTADVFVLGLMTFIGSSQLLADFNKLVMILFKLILL
jgi:hypothetical protein